MAAVLTLVQTKEIRMNVHKRNNTKTQHKQTIIRELLFHTKVTYMMYCYVIL